MAECRTGFDESGLFQASKSAGDYDDLTHALQVSGVLFLFLLVVEKAYKNGNVIPYTNTILRIVIQYTNMHYDRALIRRRESTSISCFRIIWEQTTTTTRLP